MMTRFSLRNQLLAMALAVALVALVSSGIALFFLDRASALAQLTQELTSTAKLLANRSSAALVFLDEPTAQENLRAVAGVQQVGSVCLFDQEEKVFASFSQKNDVPLPCTALLSNDNPAVVRVEVPVLDKDRVVGTLRLISVVNPLVDRMLGQLLSLGLALGSAFVLSVLLAVRLQRTIVEPIAQVRDVATAVVETGDFGLRAPDLGAHEVGRLASAFNTMLTTLAKQNSDLAQSESYTRKLFHESPISQVLIDASTGRFTDCNQTAVQQLGFTDRAELMATNPIKVSSSLQAEGVDARTAMGRFFEQLNAHGVMLSEWEFVRPDETTWQGMVHAMYLLSDKHRLIHVSVQEITQRKLAEAALSQLNLELENRVAVRTSELASANESLKSTLATLKHAQDELVQRSKLASLGSLVAGVAHELNTPLGNSILVASSLLESAQSLDRGFQAGALTRSGAARSVQVLIDGLMLLSRNLGRASELIVHFKQVAVDQASGNRREFDLSRVVVEMVETLRPQFKHTPHRITTEVPDGIVMQSYPGPLEQVLTNLVMNGLIHAFDDHAQGVITIRASLGDDAQVRIQVSDNGSGIADEHLAKVFDPFFTTKLGQGGSGLGLHIVYNIVSSTLGGHIRVTSQQGSGTTFAVEVPLIAPTGVVP